MKLDLILENIRNRYALGLLEESEGMSEKDLLKGKILINESTMNIRKMLVEEGVMDTVKQNLQEAWSAKMIEEFEDPVNDFINAASDKIGSGFDKAADYASDKFGQAADYASNKFDSLAQDANNAYRAFNGDLEPVDNSVANDKAIKAAQQAMQPAGTGEARMPTDTMGKATAYANGAASTAGRAIDTAKETVVPVAKQAGDAITSGAKQAYEATAPARASVGQAVDAAGEYANANKGIVGAGIAGAGLAGYGAMKAGNKLAGAVRR